MITYDMQKLAEQHRARNMESQNWHQPLDDSIVAPWLMNLARQYKGAFVSSAHTLPTLMHQDAIEILLTMPNQYWFWHVLSLSCERQIDADRLTESQGVLRKKSVLAAIRDLRNAGAGKEIAATGANSGQILARLKARAGFLVAAGCLVVDRESAELVLNPVFCANYGDELPLDPDFYFSHCLKSS